MALKFLPLIWRIGVATAVAFGALAANAAGPQSPATDSKERTRLEELFIWKTSEELKLAPADELKFTDAIHELNKKRRDANARMDAALSALAAAKTPAETSKALTEHRAAVRDTQSVQTLELDRLRKILGEERLAKYIVAKSSILEKLKSMLAAPASMPSTAVQQASSTDATTTPAHSAAGTTRPAGKAK